jgi:hypothetical protein
MSQDVRELINEIILKSEIVGISKHPSVLPESLRKITKDEARIFSPAEM